MDKLPFRQIHLDFHTSEAIPGIGSEWNKEHFQDMLRIGHVNSITVFAKCHHGWTYYPTQVPGAAMHPNLDFDLLGAMLEACHEIGVRAPVYISAGVDEKTAREHSEWMRREADGSTRWQHWLQAGFHELCMRSPYLDFLIAQTEEVLHKYPCDEIFLDIVGERICTCQYCIAEQIKRGKDPRNVTHQRELGRETYLNYARRIRAAIHAIKPGTPIYQNGGHTPAGDRELAFLNSHLELESLPTGGWSYDNFPITARYVHALGMEYLGMTGKFHSHWGEFGGYKHPNALRFESALSLANGAKISIGDQMHPYGKLDEATYRLIGTAYAEVEAKEPWCANVTPVADVGVLSYEAVSGIQASRQAVTGNSAHIANGVVRVLQEGHILYDVLDTECDFSKYQVIVLPDAIQLNNELRLKLQQYLDNGGKVFATGSSAIDTERGEFMLDFGAKYLGEGEYNPVYVAPRFPLQSWAPAGFVVYSNAQQLELAGGETIADLQNPFFNRDYLHFCSHMHAPSTGIDTEPAMVRTANSCYFAVPAFQLYFLSGQTVLRDIILAGIRALLVEPTLETSLPSQGINSVMRQESEKRTVVHLLYGTPVKRGQQIPTLGINSIEVIEDLVPIYNVQVALRADKAPSQVYLAPQGDVVEFSYECGIIKTTIPQVECHQMLVVQD